MNDFDEIGYAMPLDEVFNQSWTRHHDSPDVPKVRAAPRTVYAHSLQDLIDICSNRAPGEQLHAAGGHWGLSDAAISDHTFIETHDPNNSHRAMGDTLYTVLPKCMNDDFVTALAAKKAKPFTNVMPADETIYPIHIETGKRVYQLYADLDAGDSNVNSLATLLRDKYGNDSYLLSSWAFATLGGAGGQTVFGALHTGTHGGDFRIPPIADSVMAIHLVADGGRHYWIEPASFYFNIQAPLTDTKKLAQLYPDKNFEVIRDDDIFNAVLISAGRFGVVYSIVLAAVPQYTLHQERNLTNWQDIKAQINNTNGELYTQVSDYPNKFLQIAVSVTPYNSFKSNYAAVTKRRNIMVDPVHAVAGRAERVGDGSKAGNSHPYDPDPANPGAAKPASFLENACTDANFVIGVLKAVIKELEDFTSSHGAVVGPIMAAVAAAGGTGLLALLAAFLVELALLATLLAAIESAVSPRFGEVMDNLRGALLGDPNERPAGLFVWQMIAAKVFTDLQKDAKYDAISYAVMDGFDYLDQGCSKNADSIEVFFDAKDMMLVAFVDALLAFEVGQEITRGRAFVGWISLRFMGQTHALLGPQKFPISCAVEVAGLADVAGSQDLIDYAQTLALDPNYMGILHWGQHNDSSRAHIEQRFGDPLIDPACRMARWRKALGRITQDGKLTGFSSAFTRRTGLEEM